MKYLIVGGIGFLINRVELFLLYDAGHRVVPTECGALPREQRGALFGFTWNYL